MVEEILRKRYRGQRLAPAVQRAFVERLDHVKRPIVFGTIKDKNFASLRTALRTGRVDVGGWVFFPVPEFSQH